MQKKCEELYCNPMSTKKEHILSLGQVEIDKSQYDEALSNKELRVLPTRDFVMFPDVTFPISLGRQWSIDTAEAAERNHKPIAILCQKDAASDTPNIPDDLYGEGVAAMVIKVFDIPEGPKTAILHGLKKIKVVGRGSRRGYVKVEYIDEDVPAEKRDEFGICADNIRQTALRIISKTSDGPNELSFNLEHLQDAAMVVNLVTTHMPFGVEFKQKALEQSDMNQRAIEVLKELFTHEQMIDITREIQERTKTNISEAQKVNFLQQQMETIRQEIYGDDDDTAKFKAKLEERLLPSYVSEKLNAEINKLSRLNPQSPDYSVQYSYIELLFDLPWDMPAALSTDIAEAEKILDEDHYGLEKVKERVIEQIAVVMNSGNSVKSPIICLVGAPGVGKTSLAQSIAHAVGRDYQRVSLGGLHDESEIRGHRRTYIGAMPGRIIDAIRRSGTSNPLLVLDEIDKIGTDVKSDPSAALLEVLDPEQNCHFHDNYVDIDFDLSDVMFIATANTLSTLSQPLIDRMEIIDLSGYLLEEKIQIAQRHLIPKTLKELGLTATQIKFTDDAVVKIIESYTAESGVRQLQKAIATIIRKIIVKKMKKGRWTRVVKANDVSEYLGVENRVRDRYEGNDYPGVVTGLAWTSVGGEILFVETSLSKSKAEKLTLTGNLGDVMKESAMIAMQYVKANAELFGIDQDMFETTTFHIHVPEGAIPKDGPSAGITMVTSIVSAITRRKVQPRLAMTGEITLRGKVLPVGGIKEKILAAKRAGINKIILSSKNIKDIKDIPEKYIDDIEFIYVDDISQVIGNALI